MNLQFTLKGLNPHRRNHHYLIRGGLLFEKESPKSYSKGLRAGFFCSFEVYRTAIFLFEEKGYAPATINGHLCWLVD